MRRRVVDGGTVVDGGGGRRGGIAMQLLQEPREASRAPDAGTICANRWPMKY